MTYISCILHIFPIDSWKNEKLSDITQLMCEHKSIFTLFSGSSIKNVCISRYSYYDIENSEIPTGHYCGNATIE